MARSIPYVGAVVALALVGDTVRRKGLARGMVDTGLNAIPYVGAAKTVAEAVRGSEFLPDRPPSQRRGRSGGG